MAKSKRGPKFHVGQVVASRWSGYPFRISRARYGKTLGAWIYRNDDRTAWLEKELRPLTAREIGPRPQQKGKR